MHKEIKEKIKFGEWLLPLNSELSFHFVSRNVKIKIYKTVTLVAVLYGYET